MKSNYYCPASIQKKDTYKPSIFLNDLLKAAAHFNQTTQNIKLTEPTAMVGIHNSWTKSFKIFILTDFLSGLWEFFSHSILLSWCWNHWPRKKRILKSTELSFKLQGKSVQESNEPDHIQFNAKTNNHFSRIYFEILRIWLSPYVVKNCVAFPRHSTDI